MLFGGIFLIVFILLTKSRKSVKLHLVQARAEKSGLGRFENDSKMPEKGAKLAPNCVEKVP